MTLNKKDLTAGGIFILLGASFVVGALGLDIGTALRMGPGYFPLMLAGLLIVLGLFIVLQGFRHEEGVAIPSLVPPRALVLILAAPVAFGLAIRPFGLVPAVMLVVVLAAFASRRMGLPLAAALAVGLTAFCTAIFHYGLGLPIQLFGPAG